MSSFAQILPPYSPYCDDELIFHKVPYLTMFYILRSFVCVLQYFLVVNDDIRHFSKIRKLPEIEKERKSMTFLSTDILI